MVSAIHKLEPQAGFLDPFAQRAGLEALKQGGTSVDAAMTTAMTQIAAGAGAVIAAT